MNNTKKQVSIENDISKTWKIILTILLFIYLLFSYAQKQNLITADLGRHIKNGEYFIQHHEPITTNYYSYTQPDFPTRAHHWGAGVIYYVLYNIGGFDLLSLLNVFLYIITFILFFKIVIEKSNYIFSIFFTLLGMPLITDRLEIRPEVFSYCFVAIYFYLLSRFTDDKIKWQYLLVLPVVQVFWVNIHILFPLGPFLMGVFGLGELINAYPNSLKSEKLKKLAIIFLLSALACLVNFWGIQGIIEPFTILNNYGMMIVENMSVVFMQGRFPDRIIYYHIELITIITLLAIGVIVWLKKGISNIPHVILTLVFGILAWKMIRNFPLFGYMFIIVSSISFYEYQKARPINFQRNLRLFLTIGSCFIFFIGFALPSLQYFRQQLLPKRLEVLKKEYKHNPSKKDAIMDEVQEIKTKYQDIDTSWTLRNYYSPYKYSFGLGLIDNCNKSAEFIKANKIPGPYFNNYDIGGYFIFHLFPTYKPFVDNRPEAYSVDFFKDMFMPMQQDTTDITWNKFDEKYHFNTIYFYRYDQTPYGQPFLIRRIQDPLWIPIYVDDYTVIMIRNEEKNTALLQQFALDKKMFYSSPN